MRPAKVARVIRQKNRNGGFSNLIYVGTNASGKAIRRTGPTDEQQAYALAQSINQELAKLNTEGAANYTTKKHLSANSKAHHIAKLRVFFNHLVKQD